MYFECINHLNIDSFLTDFPLAICVHLLCGILTKFSILVDLEINFYLIRYMFKPWNCPHGVCNIDNVIHHLSNSGIHLKLRAETTLNKVEKSSLLLTYEVNAIGPILVIKVYPFHWTVICVPDLLVQFLYFWLAFWWYPVLHG